MAVANIRPATRFDSPGVVAVIKAVYDEYGFTWEQDGYHADLYDLDGHYLSAGHRFYVAEIEDCIVGSAALEFFPAIEGELGKLSPIAGKRRLGGCDCALNRLYVHPRARRKGVARALVETVIRDARTSGRGAMEIWSDKRFLAAHALYGRFGAVQVADRVLDDPDQSPEWGLWLGL